MPVTNPDIIQERLKSLHGPSMPWREIAKLDDYRGIPAGTLCTIAKTGKVPGRWRKRLGLPELAPAPVCVSCGSVHAGNCNPGRQMIDLAAVPLSERKYLLSEAFQRTDIINLEVKNGRE